MRKVFAAAPKPPLYSPSNNRSIVWCRHLSVGTRYDRLTPIVCPGILYLGQLQASHEVLDLCWCELNPPAGLAAMLYQKAASSTVPLGL